MSILGSRGEDEGFARQEGGKRKGRRVFRRPSGGQGVFMTGFGAGVVPAGVVVPPPAVAGFSFELPGEPGAGLGFVSFASLHPKAVTAARRNVQNTFFIRGP